MDDSGAPLVAAALGVRVTGLPLAPWPRRHVAALSSSSIAWHGHRAPVPGDIDGWSSEATDAVTIGWGAFAEYRLRVDPRPTVDVVIDDISDADAVLAFMLSVLPMALPLFGLEPFHGSAVRVGDGAALFLGGRGGGKSSTAAALHSIGYSVLTDDACAIDADGVLWPGPPLVSPRDDRAEQRVVGRYNKKFLRSVGDTDGNPSSVEQVFLLQPKPGTDLSFRRLSAAEAFPAVIAQSRHPLFLAEVRRDLQFRLAAHLSRLGVSVIEYDPERCSFLDVATEVTGSLRVGAA